MESLSRERIRYLHGGQIEGLVAYTLKGLDDKWHLFNGISREGCGDIDHILVGSAGLFCISTKGTRGTYTQTSDKKLLMNGNPCDHATQAVRQAMMLREWMEPGLLAGNSLKEVPYVQAVLAAPLMFISPALRCDHVWVVDERRLLNMLLNISTSNRLKPSEVEACVKTLEDLSRSDTSHVN